MNIYTHTYYDDISINTMKMFVVRRYWNMDSEYIFAVMHICIYAYDRVCICIVCVCVWSRITQWHTWTMLLRLHFAEAFGSSQFRGKNFVRSRLFFVCLFVCFFHLMAFSQTDCWRRKESSTWTVWGVYAVSVKTVKTLLDHLIWITSTNSAFPLRLRKV